MKVYISVTGAIFALVAVLHGLRAYADRADMAREPIHYFVLCGIGVLCAALSVWAFSLVRRPAQPSNLASR